MQTKPHYPRLLFETSWEVCNKVGGIYTVLSTKAKVLKERFGDNLIFVGPDVWDAGHPSPVFIERKSLLKNCASRVRLPYGISVRVGRWDIPGSPIVMLVKYDGVYGVLNDIFGDMWNDYGVDSLHAYGDYDESCAFAIAAAIAVMGVASHLKVDERDVMAHFDEWTTGMGLLYLKKHAPQMATVFTAHATCIGRSICGNGKPLYDYFDGYDGDQMAAELNMQSKHSLEKAAAHQADCFTAVSDVTAHECEGLLGIRPQVVTPNGFEPGFVPSAQRRAAQRASGRRRLLSIARSLTGREWPDDTFVVATSGRNEYRNKGIDLYLDAVERLRSGSPLPAHGTLALILVPAWVKEPSGALLVDMNDHGDADVRPDYLTHRLNNEDTDPTSCRLREMESHAGDGHVKAVFVPCYLDGHDGIVDIAYYDLLPALDMTVFPSYYEPWGYTPLESVAFGVPTVTSDKSGFGQWVSAECGGFASSGVDVIARTDSNYHEAAEKVAEAMAGFCALDGADRAALGRAAMETASKADWKYFIARYYKAFEIAEERRDARCGKSA